MKRIWFLVAGVILVLGIGAGLVFGLGNGPKTYTVEITSNVEQIEYESKNNCRLGDTIIIEAIQKEGYRFIGWEVNDEIVSDEEKYEITLNEGNVNDEYIAIYEKLTFNITMPTTQTGYTINDINNETFTTMVVEYGDSISFKVELKTGYTGTPVVKNNRQTITADNDVYTISNVTSDVNITITGVKRITYTVTVPSQQTGYTIKNTNNQFFDIASVRYGDSISFIVELEYGYTGTPIVTNEGNDTVTNENGVYTISSVTDNVSILVSGITPEEYTITFQEEVTVTRNNIQLTSGATIYYGDILTLSPTTAPTDGITPVYVINGTETTSNNITVASNVTIEYVKVMNESEYQTLTFTYNESAKTAEVKANSSNKPTGELVIPARVSYNNKIYRVTGIYSTSNFSNGAFYNCSDLTSLIIPDSLISIGSWAFYNCSNLTSITIPNSVTSIGDGAFCNCSSLTSITIPNSVTSIRDSAFKNCSSLTSIAIPNSVTSIGFYAFSNCSSLNGVTIENIESWLNISFTYSSSNPLYYAHHLYIGNNEVTELIIPEGITQIKNYTFYNCSSLTSVTISNGVTSIGNEAFRGCDNLYIVNNLSQLNITVGYSDNGNIASYAHLVISDEEFSTDKIEEIEGVVYYKESANNYHALYVTDKTTTSVTLNENTTNICRYSFYNCSSLTSITIPNTVTSIGDAFYKCSSLTSVIIENIDSWLNISFVDVYSNPLYYAHHLYIGNNEVTELAIPEGITEIKNNTFSGCSGLTSVTIPNSVTNICDSAFNGCSSLTSITIPSGVTSIGSSAFYGCSSLTSITIPSGVTSISSSAFYNCSSLTGSITIPNGVTSIGSSAFYGCYRLTSIIIPNSVTSIGSSAFYDCRSLTGVTIPNSVTSIGDHAFSRCSSLTSITIPDSVTSIGDAVFSRCDNLTSVILGGGVTSIGYWTFQYCNNLTSITIPNSVTSIASDAFQYCRSLTSITIPNSVTSIGDAVFEGCNSLTNVTIPESVTSIWRNIFDGCSSLTSVTFENPNGWFVSSSKNATSGTDVTLTDPSTNATYLKSTYRDKYWKRSA